MADLLQQLQSDEAAGLMYIAGELSPADRAEFERRLASDPGLVAKVDALHAMGEQVFSGMANMDHAGFERVNMPASMRQASRTMRQWVVEQTRRPVAPSEPQRLIRFPWWTYPLTAAAVIVVGFLVWSSNRPVEEQVAENNGMYSSEYNAPIPSDSPRVDWFADRLERSFSAVQDPADPDSSISRLNDVEGEVVALAKGQATSTVFDDEQN